MTLILALMFLVQDPSLGELLEGLRSESLEDREKAAETLTRVIDRNVTDVRNAWLREEDAEVKARLGDLLRPSKSYRALLAREFVADRPEIRKRAEGELLLMKDEILSVLTAHLESLNHGKRAREFIATALKDRLTSGCIASVTSDKARYQEDEPVLLKLVVWNLTDKPVRIYAPITHQVVVGGAGLSEWAYWHGPQRKNILLKAGGVHRESAKVEIRPGAGVHRIEVGRSGGPVRGTVRFEIDTTPDPELRRKKVERLVKELDGARYAHQPGNDLADLGAGIFEQLKSHHRHESDAVRTKLVSLFHRLGKEKARPLLEAYLKDDSRDVRYAAVGTLLALGAGPSRKKIYARLDDPDAQVRWRVMSVLEKDDSEGATKSLLGRLMDDASNVRLTAAAILAHRGRKDGLQILVKDGLQSQSEFDYIRAIPALEKLTGRSFGRVQNSMFSSSTHTIRKITEANLVVRDKWLEWWEKNK